MNKIKSIQIIFTKEYRDFVIENNKMVGIATKPNFIGPEFIVENPNEEIWYSVLPDFIEVNIGTLKNYPLTNMRDTYYYPVSTISRLRVKYDD